jgi:hypothetical protein
VIVESNLSHHWGIVNQRLKTSVVTSKPAICGRVKTGH